MPPVDRFTVTLTPEFTAKTNPDEFALDPMFTFQTVEGERVYAFNRRALLLARWHEPQHRDSRASFLMPGLYTFGREVEATVERKPSGHLRLIALARADAKIRA